MRIVDTFDLRELSPEKEIGIEIEMEGRGLPEAPSGWIHTADGSLRGEALEYVLREPIERKNIKEYLNRLQSAFIDKRSRLLPSDRCGVHIHINCQQLTHQQVINFTMLYLIFEEMLVRWCGPTREGNLFCLRAKDAEFLVHALIKAQQQVSLNNIQDDLYRYASINLTSLRKYGSVEFRSLRTSVNYENEIPLWVDMLLAIKDHSMKMETSKQLIENISAKGYEQFAEEVFGNNLGILRTVDTWSNIRDGIRRVQDVAYAKVVPVTLKKHNKKSAIEDIIFNATLPRLNNNIQSAAPIPRNRWPNAIFYDGNAYEEEESEPQVDTLRLILVDMVGDI